MTPFMLLQTAVPLETIHAPDHMGVWFLATVVKMIAGLLRPDGGSISLFGSDPGNPAARAELGFAPEDPDFPKFLRAPEVLDYFASLLGLDDEERKRRIPETLAFAGLDHERRQGRQYSKGMKQRLGIAQAILGRPKLLILDEPTADLDPLGRRDVRALIERLKESGVAVLLNSHLLSEVERVCDNVAILARGRVLKEGTMSDVVPEGSTAGSTAVAPAPGISTSASAATRKNGRERRRRIPRRLSSIP